MKFSPKTMAIIILVCACIGFFYRKAYQNEENVIMTDEVVCSDTEYESTDEELEEICYNCGEEITWAEYADYINGVYVSLCKKCADYLDESRTPIYVKGEPHYLSSAKVTDNGKWFFIPVPYFFDETKNTETCIVMECYDGNGETIIVSWEDLYVQLREESDKSISREMLNMDVLMINSNATEILSLWEIPHTTTKVWIVDELIYIIAYLDVNDDDENDIIEIVTLKDGVKYSYWYCCGKNTEHISSVFEIAEGAGYPTLEELEEYWS